MADRNPGPNPGPADIKALLTPGRRVLGLDLGTKTIGLAISDARWLLASPLHTIRRTKFTQDARELLDLCAREHVAALVLGWPVEMDGTEGKRCQSTRQFAANLRPLTDLPVAYWDERLSTAAVQRMMIDEMDLSRKKRAENVDKLAAAYILQGFLDTMARV
ncbi:Holliday junction resolvase RuvX [Novispirillum sp. DQ9]|uniref:Holliday junction resolvase RuvX n=1 Tax=Novispirillum sp. DQ9 TaxID=3398612 RepID=UPI003C799959